MNVSVLSTATAKKNFQNDYKIRWIFKCFLWNYVELFWVHIAGYHKTCETFLVSFFFFFCPREMFRKSVFYFWVKSVTRHFSWTARMCKFLATVSLLEICRFSLKYISLKLLHALIEEDSWVFNISSETKTWLIFNRSVNWTIN